MRKKDWTCGSCKFMAQGESSCFCAHKYPFKENKEYTYYWFSCPKYEVGIHDSILKQSPNYDKHLI